MAVSNLKSWQPGQSGNPSGRPKGSRNISSIVGSLLDDPSVYKRIPDWDQPFSSNTPVEAIIITLIAKATKGDIRSAELLLRYGYNIDEKNEHYEPPIALVDFVDSRCAKCS